MPTFHGPRNPTQQAGSIDLPLISLNLLALRRTSAEDHWSLCASVHRGGWYICNRPKHDDPIHVGYGNDGPVRAWVDR